MARTGMTDLIATLRGMTESGTADWTLGTVSFWSDNHVQDVLDLHRKDYVFQELMPYPTQGSGGTVLYNQYRAPVGNFEQTTGGTAIFYVQDGTGANVGTALYSVDYVRGVVTFASNTRGTSYFLTGSSYDLNAAAADIWNRKASHYAASAFNFSTDNHSVSREAIHQHCMQMAAKFESLSGDSIQSVQLWRNDTDGCIDDD